MPWTTRGRSRTSRSDNGPSGTAGEESLLSALALRSKGHWGYDADFIEACREPLTITAAYIASHPIFVAEIENTVLGFYSLHDAPPPETELDNLFIDPPAIGTGAGRLLWLHAIATATELGHRVMLIEADPFAEGFYSSKGAVRMGSRPSSIIPGRELPLLRFDLRSDHARDIKDKS